MKANLLTSIFLLLSLNGFSQEVCKSSEETITDLNSISISKCEIENTKEKKVKPTQRKITRTSISSRKRITSRFKTTPKRIKSNLSLNNNLKQALINTSSTTKNKLNTKSVLFKLVDEVPLFPSCSNGDKIENIKCFKNNMQKHFIKNFDPESIVEDNISGKVIIRFKITIDGSIKEPQIISSKKSNKLKEEVIKILSKLPSLQPGKVNGLPVNVDYVFPINLTSE